MRNSIYCFVAGFVVASFIFGYSNRSDDNEDGQGLLSRSLREHRQSVGSKRSTTNSHRSVTALAPIPEPGRSVARLKAQLLDSSISDRFADFLARLTDEQAHSISRSITNFEERLRIHETRNVQIVSETEEKVTLFVPAQGRFGEAEEHFLQALTQELGREGACRFLAVAATDELGSQFAFWGAAEQSIEIDLAHTPPLIKQRIAINKPRGTARLATRYANYGQDGGRFAHLFEMID